MHKIFTMPFAQVYPHYVNKIERKGRSVKELHEVITWLTGFSDFFKVAKLHKNAKLITGTICGVKIEDIEEPLMKKIRYMDKIVDELAKGRPLEKILRKKD